MTIWANRVVSTNQPYSFVSKIVIQQHITKQPEGAKHS